MKIHTTFLVKHFNSRQLNDWSSWTDTNSLVNSTHTHITNPLSLTFQAAAVKKCMCFRDDCNKK